jgi:general secretion pathway protein L
MSRALLRHALAEFLHWWRGELLGLVPARPRRSPAVLAVTLAPDGTCSAVLHHSGQAPRTVLPPSSSTDALVTAAAGMGLRLAVGLAEALTRRIALPLAAADRLEEVLALDLDRQTPFRAEEVAFAARVIARDPASRMLTATLTVAPRNAVARATRLAATLGLRLHYAGPTPAPPWQDDLKPHAAAKTRAAPVARGLWALAAVLLLAAAVVPAWRAQQRLAALEAELAQARRQADAVLARRAESDAVAAPAALLAALGAPATTLVAALTAALPDDAVLRRLVLRDGRLEITGSSAGTAELAVRLSAAPSFAQVEYRSPVVAAGARENFHLALSPRVAAP